MLVDFVVLTFKISCVFAAFIAGMYGWFQLGDYLFVLYGTPGAAGYGVISLAAIISAIVVWS